MPGIIEDTELRDRVYVFQDRQDAGSSLARFLKERLQFTTPVVCAIPAGGVPVGLEVARAFSAPLVPAVVRKLRIPWNPEAGFGAVTWDGRVLFNEKLMKSLRLTEAEIDAALEISRENVRERLHKFTRDAPFPSLRDREVILTDDGLASGYTMKAAVEAVREQGPSSVVVAVPTGSLSTAKWLAPFTDTLVCLNIRTSYSFAVADAYRRWHDLHDEEVVTLLLQAREEGLV
ncbi:putative phosphoribosyltransferase [Methanolinea mesophila]|uniref:phosphoribosyltransferase n=1 Tax=Methanolinea mesophila TaxID=547055 RepID=UPI0031591160|nr:putative phosphoribosyltransferase [Methanolinea mesophila]